MKMSKSIILLLVWFFWATGQDLDAIVRYWLMSDYYIFSSHGISPLFFIFAFLVFSLNTTTIYYLFKPSPLGVYAGFGALAAALVQNLVTAGLALGDLDGVREAYAASREARGLSVREGALDLIFTPNGIYTSVAVMAVFYLVIGFLLFRNRTYFRSPSGGMSA